TSSPKLTENLGLGKRGLDPGQPERQRLPPPPAGISRAGAAPIHLPTEMAAKIYNDNDASLEPLKDKTLAVIGFGSQGHAHALNLMDSGMNVVIGLYEGSKSREAATQLGFKVVSTAEAVKAADVIFVATPDTVIPEVFAKDIAPNLSEGKTLLFSHG